MSEEYTVYANGHPFAKALSRDAAKTLIIALDRWDNECGGETSYTVDDALGLVVLVAKLGDNYFAESYAGETKDEFRARIAWEVLPESESEKAYSVPILPYTDATQQWERFAAPFGRADSIPVATVEVSANPPTEVRGPCPECGCFPGERAEGSDGDPSEVGLYQQWQCECDCHGEMDD